MTHVKPNSIFYALRAGTDKQIKQCIEFFRIKYCSKIKYIKKLIKDLKMISKNPFSMMLHSYRMQCRKIFSAFVRFFCKTLFSFSDSLGDFFILWSVHIFFSNFIASNQIVFLKFALNDDFC